MEIATLYKLMSSVLKGIYSPIPKNKEPVFNLISKIKQNCARREKKKYAKITILRNVCGLPLICLYIVLHFSLLPLHFPFLNSPTCFPLFLFTKLSVKAHKQLNIETKIVLNKP